MLFRSSPETEKIVTPTEIKQELPMNESLKNLSGRQYQNVMRIVRQFGNGKLTKQQASLMLKNGFGFTDSDVDTFLGIDDDPATEFQKFSDDLLLAEFSQCGESRSSYEIIETKSFKDYQEFADAPLTQLEADVLSLITKDGLSTPEVIAKTLKRSKSDIEDVISNLLDRKIISEKKTIVGTDVQIERIPNQTVSELPGKDSKVTDILVRYSYEGPKDSRNRPFCAKLLDLDRFYSRQDIEKISERLGYSVWDRRGGWFTQPDGTHRPYCRHIWMVNIVKRK